MSLCLNGCVCAPRGVLPYSLGGRVCHWVRESPTLYQTKNAQLFLISVFCGDPVKQNPIVDQFSVITRPYTRPNGLKTIPSTRPNGLKTIPYTRTNDLKSIPSSTAHTGIANIWEYPPGVCTRLYFEGVY